MAFSVFTTPIDARSTGSLHRPLIFGPLVGGLVSPPITTLEDRFATEHSMLVAPETRLVLRGLLPHLDARDLILTDANGFNAIISDRSSDFVQNDETWWQDAWRDGRSSSDAA